MKKRYLFLDVLRAIAVAEMIHGHSLDGLLDITLRYTPFFVNWTHVRGYTAPIFLFAAGFAFAIVTLPRIDQYSKFSKTLLQRIQRLSFVVLLGYLMYLPHFSLRMTILSVGTPAWDSLLRVDILRCIGVSVICLQLWFLPKPNRVVTWAVIGLATIALPVLTPVVRDSGFVQSMPDVIRYYFMDSRFPLFYYSSFLFLGFMMGFLFNEQRNSWVEYSLVIALVLIVFGQILPWAGVLSGLRSFVTKGGVIILLTVLLQRCEGVWVRLPSPVKYFGQESLVVYVVHLMVIYGSVLNKGMVSYWNATLSYAEVYLFIGWLLAAMLVLAYIWHKLKIEHARVAKWVKRMIYWSFLILFLLKPY